MPSLNAVSCALALCAAAVACHAEEPVLAFAGSYEGRKTVAMLPATARAELRLRRTGAYLVYTMNTTVRWAFVERAFRDCSVLQIEPGPLRPLEYRHVDEGNAGLNVHTRFDWAQRRATTQLGAEAATKDLELSAPTWDPLSYQVALMALAQRRPPGELDSHRVIERGALKEHHASMAEAAPLVVRGRSYSAHEIVSRKDSGSIVLHLGPDLGWRPLRLAIEGVAFELVAGGVAEPASATPASATAQPPRCEDPR